jgi:hypothetical protein
LAAGLDRREFLVGGIKASLAFLACGPLARPAWGARHAGGPVGHPPIREASLTRIPSLDESLQVLAAYLARYAPPPGPFPATGGWRATYDLIEWEGSPIDAAFLRRNRVIGNLALARKPGAPGAGLAYEADQVIRMQGFESSLRSSLQCSADRLPRLLSWNTQYRCRPLGRPGATQTLDEQGRHAGGFLEIKSAAGVRRLPAPRPVASQWVVLDALRGQRADAADALAVGEFDLFHDLTSLRPEQRIAPCGRLDLQLGAERHQLHGFVQTGRGTEPTHYWIDAAGRPLLVTAGLLSMALASVQA